MTSPALISVKASLTRMTPLLAAGCGASMVDLLLVEPAHDWAVGEELLFSPSSRSVSLTHQSQPHPRNYLWDLEAVPARQWPQSSQHCAIWAA